MPLCYRNFRNYEVAGQHWSISSHVLFISASRITSPSDCYVIGATADQLLTSYGFDQLYWPPLTTQAVQAQPSMFSASSLSVHDMVSIISSRHSRGLHTTAYNSIQHDWIGNVLKYTCLPTCPYRIPWLWSSLHISMYSNVRTFGSCWVAQW